jgi:hypothetical protein
MAEPQWPSLEHQLDGVPRGSALEKLIAENQGFELLRGEVAGDRTGVPPWLRAYWRKQHPEHEDRPDDPAGGYPRALRALYAWMLAHPDLEPEAEAHTREEGVEGVTESEESDPDGATSEADPRPAAEDTRILKVTVGTDLRLSGSQTTGRSESDIRIDPNNTNRVIAASNAIGASRQAQYWSSDGGSNWSETQLALTSSDSLHSDPAVDWTSDGTAWAVTIGIQGSTFRLRAYRSPDGGASWNFDATASGNQTATDKHLMWVDHSATSPFQDNIYLIWHNNLPVFVNRRTGPNGSWQTPVQVSGAETTGTGIGGDITANSAGDVFALWPDTGSRRLFVAKSANGGVGFGAPVAIATTFASFDIGVPAFTSRRALIFVSAAAYRSSAKDLVHAVWTDLTGAAGCTTSSNEPNTTVTSVCKTRVWYSRSVDGGATWAVARMLNDQTGLNDQFNPRLSLDETSGALAVIYYDTVDDPGRRRTDVWVQASDDDGSTWTQASKITTAQTDETAAGADSGNQYGDYNGLSGRGGRFLPSWTDRRDGAREEIWTASIYSNIQNLPGVSVGRSL